MLGALVTLRAGVALLHGHVVVLDRHSRVRLVDATWCSSTTHWVSSHLDALLTHDLPRTIVVAMHVVVLRSPSSSHIARGKIEGSWRRSALGTVVIVPVVHLLVVLMSIVVHRIHPLCR